MCSLCAGIYKICTRLYEYVYIGFVRFRFKPINRWSSVGVYEYISYTHRLGRVSWVVLGANATQVITKLIKKKKNDILI